MSGIILLPTLNRPKLLERFIETYKRTTGNNTAVWVLVDNEDIKNYATSDWDRILLKNTQSAVTMGDKIRLIWPEIKQENPQWIGLLNDDHVCITPEWDKKVEAMLDGTNMVSTNDGNWNFGFNVVGLTAWSTQLLETCGFPIFPRNLHHYFIDNLWKAIGESTGCWLETSKINIEHRHVFCGKMEADDTFKKVNAPKANEYDQKEFQHFMEQDFKDVCMRIVELRSKQVLQNKFA